MMGIRFPPPPACRLGFPDLPGRFNPIHQRHLNIHQNQIVRTRKHRVNRLETGPNNGKTNPLFADEITHDHLAHRAILC